MKRPNYEIASTQHLAGGKEWTVYRCLLCSKLICEIDLHNHLNGYHGVDAVSADEVEERAS